MPENLAKSGDVHHTSALRISFVDDPTYTARVGLSTHFKNYFALEQIAPVFKD